MAEKEALVILLFLTSIHPLLSSLTSPTRQLPALGECLATLAGALPVAFLEPQLNTYNPCSVFNTKSVRERASESGSSVLGAVRVGRRGGQ